VPYNVWTFEVDLIDVVIEFLSMVMVCQSYNSVYLIILVLALSLARNSQFLNWPFFMWPKYVNF